MVVAAQNRCEIKTKSIYAHVLMPVPEAVENELPDTGMVDIECVAATGVVNVDAGTIGFTRAPVFSPTPIIRVTILGNWPLRARGSASVSPLRTLSADSRMALAKTSFPAVRSTISMACKIATPLFVSVESVRVKRLTEDLRKSEPNTGNRNLIASRLYAPCLVSP